MADKHDDRQREQNAPAPAPTAETAEAMNELASGRGKRFGTAEALFQDLGLSRDDQAGD